MVGKLALVGVAAACLAAGGCKCDCNKAGEKPTAETKNYQPVTDAQDPAGAAAHTKMIPVNTFCPLGKHGFDATTRDAETARMYKGSIIGFCCEDCSAKFDTMTAAEKDQVLAAAKANKPV